MTRYFLGVDIGGTKSHALVADESGCAVGLGRGGPGNHQVVGYSGLEATLKDITGQALASAGISQEQLTGAGLGVAGYDWPSDREAIMAVIHSLGIQAPLEVVNDTIIGLMAGSESGWGVAVVAGTSNNCRGWDRHRREGRVVGNGQWFGEFGGASELVMKATQQVVAAWARRGSATRLTEAFIELVGARDAFDLIEGLAQNRHHLKPEIAPVIFSVAAEGDQVAGEIIAWSGRELGSLAAGVIRQLNLEGQEFDVVLVGSLFNGGAALIEPMRETILSVAPKARLVRLTTLPVVGGVLLGMELAGIGGPLIRKRLEETLNGLIGEQEKAGNIQERFHHAKEDLA